LDTDACADVNLDEMHNWDCDPRKDDCEDIYDLYPYPKVMEDPTPSTNNTTQLPWNSTELFNALQLLQNFENGNSGLGNHGLDNKLHYGGSQPVQNIFNISPVISNVMDTKEHGLSAQHLDAKYKPVVTTNHSSEETITQKKAEYTKGISALESKLAAVYKIQTELKAEIKFLSQKERKIRDDKTIHDTVSLHGI